MSTPSILTLTIGRRLKAHVNSYAAASRLYEQHRDYSGEGASTFPWGDITDQDGTLVARVSYNGRVWAPGADVGDTPIYDNRIGENA